MVEKGICNKGFIWNPSIWECECKSCDTGECDKSYDTGEYLNYENCKGEKISW